MTRITTNGPFDRQGDAHARGAARVAWVARVAAHGRNELERLERRALLAAVPLGSEFRANTFTAGFQADPAVAVDADGSAVVTWYSYAQDGDGRGIYAKRYAPDGTPTSDEFRVNTHTTGSQTNPAVATDSDGDFVIVWQSDGQDGGGWGVYGQRYNSAGLPQGGEFRVNSTTTGNQQAPAVAMDADGDFVVVWEQDSASGAAGIGARRFNSAGVPQGNQFTVALSTLAFAPAVSTSPGGAFVVAWGGSAPGDGQGVAMRLFDPNGAPLSNETAVNTFTTGEQYYPSVAVAASGEFVIAWDSKEQDGSGWGVYAQRFNALGAKQGGELRVNTYTTDYQQNASVAIDADGDFVVAWTSSADQNGTGYGVYAQQFNATGGPQGGEFRVNTFTSNVQQYPSVASEANGNFLVAWESFGQDGSGFGVYAQRFAPELVVTSSAFHFATAPHQLRFTFNADVSASLGTDDLVVQNLTSGGTIPSSNFALSYDTGTNTATFTYTGPGGATPGTLGNGSYRATLLAAGIMTPEGIPLSSDQVLLFFFLLGDANHDGRVNLRDFNVLAGNFGQSPRDYTQGDFNYDGTVNLLDFNILANRFGQMLFGAAAAPSTRFGSTRNNDDRNNPLDDLME